MLDDVTPFANRLLPARPDLAAEHLRGRVDAKRYVPGEVRRVTAAVLALTTSPDPASERATQLLYGEAFTVYETRDDGLAWGQAALDGYVGYVRAGGLGAAGEPGERITALWSHIYPWPQDRAPAQDELPFLAEVEIDAGGGNARYAALRGGGFVPRRHLEPVAGDFVMQAERFLGVPYLWGGRSARGIDCSALVQLSLIACGRQTPRDADMQAAMVGEKQAPDEPAQRGDLIFWKGHVGILHDPETLLHANAHAMAVAFEPLGAAIARIEAAGGGPVTARRRP